MLSFKCTWDDILNGSEMKDMEEFLCVKNGECPGLDVGLLHDGWNDIKGFWENYI